MHQANDDYGRKVISVGFLMTKLLGQPVCGNHRGMFEFKLRRSGPLIPYTFAISPGGGMAVLHLHRAGEF